MRRLRTGLVLLLPVLAVVAGAVAWRAAFPPRHYRLDTPSQAPFHATGIAPSPVPTTFQGRGRTYRALTLEPNRRYRNLNFPDLPQLVMPRGVLPPTRRFLRYSCTVNEDGIRGPGRPSFTSSPDRFRIGVLGTGVSFGEGVEDHQVYTVLLESMLNQDPPLDRRFEVLNFAVPCQTMDTALGTFQLQASRYAVDFWIVALGVNDALPMFNRPLEAFRNDVRALMVEMASAGVRGAVLVEPVNTFYPWMHLYPGYLEALTSEVAPTLPLFDLADVLDCHERKEGLRLEAEGGEQRIVRYTNGQPTVLARASYQARGPGQQYMSPELYTWLDGSDAYLRTFITDVHLNPYGHEVAARALHTWIGARLRQEPAPVLDPATCQLAGAPGPQAGP